MISSSHSVNSTLIKNLSYDLTRDVVPITQATTQPYALVVHPSVQAKSVKELIALAKAKPGQLNYGSSGTGGLSHLSGALFSSLAHIDIVHIPRAAPELPTMQEAGVKGYEVAGWYGVIAPLKTPQAIIERLNKEIVAILHQAQVASRLAADGSEPVGSTPQQFGQHIKSEVAKWASS